VVETYRRQFRNIVMAGKVASHRAKLLISRVRRDPSQVSLLEELELGTCEGYPNPGQLQRRAKVLVDTFERIFPNRARTDDLAEPEILRLIEEGAEAFARLDRPPPPDGEARA
jgi:hypothetical protein